MALSLLVAWALIAVFASLSLLHIYWCLGGQLGQGAAIPEIDGKLAFQPTTVTTLVVAIGLALCVLLIAATAGILTVTLPQTVLAWLTRALAVILLVRAIRDFRLVGFFKRVCDTHFAHLDTAVYSPLCLALALGTAIVGFAA